MIAAALVAQLVVVGGDPAACKANRETVERPVGTMSVRELLEIMSRADCVRFLVPSHLLGKTVELPASTGVAKDWRGPVQRVLGGLGISLHEESVMRVEGPAAPPSPPPLSDAELDRGIKCKSPGHCVLARGLLDRLLADSTTLATAARIVPSFRDGHPDGFRLFAMRPGSLWTRLGFENGDTLQTVNGMDLTSPEKALEIYSRLRATTELAVGVVRRGQPLTAQIEIR
ncbi:MAG TPA: type II secretion system protein GspC [Polyangia bacterium]